MKKSFSILEIILVITLISFLYTAFFPKIKINNLNELANKISLYITYVRYKALIDNKYDLDDTLWHKQRWTIKFFNCRESVGGIYYVIYTDRNQSGHPSAQDSLRDPLTNKKIYSFNTCDENDINSKYVLLTKEYEIKDVNISCNDTSTLGQLSFGSDGKIYSRLSAFDNESEEYEIEEPCRIEFISKANEKKEIIIYPYTGYNKQD
ncbi:MAG: type II secretion system protein [Aliarcobacter sp.]|jgi:type II secretory pathway pseudopilin PulG|nr:type II secretion system protein [Aliarcobacter sp.]